MGFFKKSLLEQLQKTCDDVGQLAGKIRSHSDRSLKGKYDHEMSTEERADQLKAAHALAGKLESSVEKAKSQQAAIGSDGGNDEDIMAAETITLAAILDATKARESLHEAHQNLLSGVAEVEQFYGPRSREARHLRRILSKFEG